MGVDIALRRCGEIALYNIRTIIRECARIEHIGLQLEFIGEFAIVIHIGIEACILVEAVESVQSLLGKGSIAVSSCVLLGNIMP